MIDEVGARTDEILNSVVAGARLSVEDAIALFHSYDLTSLGISADAICNKLHPEQIKTFVVDRNINYTNICTSGCKFCAFYRTKGDPDAYVISQDQLFQKIEETLSLGGTQILMQGGLHPDLKLDYYVSLLRSIKDRFDIHIHSFSPPEIIHFAQLNNLEVSDVISTLRDAGLDTIPGGGAEILDDECRRRISPNKCTSSEWLEVMRAAHKLGMRTTATMMFGHLETIEQRVSHLAKIRDLQAEAHPCLRVTHRQERAGKNSGFTAFIPWTFQPRNTALSNEGEEFSTPSTELSIDAPARLCVARRQVGGFDYLKTLAITRLFLDNIANIQASWVTQGAKIAQLALKFGANDLGSTMIEENVVRAAGVSFRCPKKEMIFLIEDIGYKARQRDCYYNLIGDTT